MGYSILDSVVKNYLSQLPGSFRFLFQKNNAFPRVFSIILDALEDISLSSSESWNENKWDQVQAKRIASLVEYARRRIPFYMKCLAFQLPIVSKHDFRSSGMSYQADWIPRHNLYFGKTSGSTGEPFEFSVDAMSIHRRLAVYRRLLKWTGHKKGDSILRIVLWGSNRIGMEQDKRYGTLFTMSHENAKEKTLELLLMTKSGTWVIEVSGSLLLSIAEIAKEKNYKFSNIRAFISVSEGLAPEERREIESILRVPIYNLYSCRDLGFIASECSTHEGLHINQEAIYLEIVDKSGLPLPRGKKGRIIITTFDNLATPFIRFETGDWGKILETPCSCGRTLPLLELEGRDIEYILTPENSRVHIFKLMPVVYKYSKYIRSIQFIQRSPHQIVARIVPTLSITERTRQQIKDSFQETINSNIEIIIELTETLTTPPYQKRRLLLSDLQ